MAANSDVEAEPFAIEEVRKQYVLNVDGRIMELEITAMVKEPQPESFPPPWRLIDLGCAWVAWRLVV